MKSPLYQSDLFGTARKRDKCENNVLNAQNWAKVFIAFDNTFE